MAQVQQNNSAILERARMVLAQHDPSASVSLDGSSLKVDSIIPAEAVVRLLRGASIGVLADSRAPSGECCGGCCGGNASAN